MRRDSPRCVGVRRSASGRLAPRYLPAVWLFLLLACPSPARDSGVFDPEDRLAQLTEVAVACDASVPAWKLELHADGWTGGGQLWMSVDGAYMEAHPFVSKAAAIDGSSDRLDVTLTVVSDFRDVSPGSRTSFNCGTPDLQGLLVIYGRDGESLADCRAFGTAPAHWTDWGIGACEDTVTVLPALP
jgi:hypothetical protein